MSTHTKLAKSPADMRQDIGHRLLPQGRKERVQQMLLQWGHEVATNTGPDNILANPDAVHGEGGHADPTGAAMFTPLAEKCDLILRDIRKLDPAYYGLLVAFAFGLSVREIARSFGLGRTHAREQLGEAFGVFEGIRWLRAEMRHWRV